MSIQILLYIDLPMTAKVGIAGATGYVGAELLRLCAGHPELQVTVAASRSRHGAAVGSVYPSLAAAYPDLVLAAGEIRQELKGVDVCFLALPHGESQLVAGEIEGAVGSVIDLAADFRLRDPDVYAQWYGGAHKAPELIGRFAYGLPELFREQLAGARLIAAPGCYPTAAALAVAPFTRSGSVEPHGIVVDAASGLSGAGRSLTERDALRGSRRGLRARTVFSSIATPRRSSRLQVRACCSPRISPR